MHILVAKEQSLKIEFSLEALFKITLFVLGLFFLYAIRRVLLVVFISFIIMSAFTPIVRWMEKKKLSRGWAIAIIYILFFGVFVGTIVAISFPLISEFTKFISKIPEYTAVLLERLSFLNRFVEADQLEQYLLDASQQFAGQFLSLSSNFFKFIQQAVSVVGLVFSLISIAILSLYMLIEHDRAMSALLNIVPVKNRVKAMKLIDEVEESLGAWLRGQFTVSFLTSILCWIALTALGVEFAIPLSMVVFILDSIPNFGATIAFIPAWIVALVSGDWIQIIGVPVAYLLIQQFENLVVVPRIMKKVVGLNPVITMIAFLVGAELASVAGALLAVPVAAVLQIFLKEYKETIVGKK